MKDLRRQIKDLRRHLVKTREALALETIQRQEDAGTIAELRTLIQELSS